LAFLEKFEILIRNKKINRISWNIKIYKRREDAREMGVKNVWEVPQDGC
jgi:uncharacterized protein YqgV (UPF0045/DUF77 family)